MANQIVVSAGAKVRNLSGVLTGTSGVVNSLPINASNGIPQLDVNGKILVSQLPNSVMEYKGTWNVSTNTPTLVNGTGNQGDVYLVEGAAVGGTAFNFGAGPITFFNGDQAIYSGSIWQRGSGATGTVTSVAVTESGDSLNITGSPITTSGTINIGFNGTNLQYVNGAGNLTTFPTLITSIGLSMPSAFSVANSPLTANGTIAVTGAGVASQYIRGDGTLADFPSSGGGGSSVSYYLNGGTSQGTIGGTTYYEMSKTAVVGTGVDFAKSGDGLIVAFLTDANDPAQLNIPAGNWNYEIYASMSSNGGTPQMYAELYVYDGTTFTLIATSSNEILYDGVNLNLYTFAMAVPATTLSLTDRLAVKLYATNSGGKTTTVHTQDSHLCQVITTFSTGITALNGLTAQVQYFQVGTSGTDFNISSTTATHTFNIPDASATARGLITTGTQTIAGIKTFSSGINVDYIGVTGDISMDGSFLLKQVAYGTLQSGYTNLSGQTNGLRVGLFGGYNALLNFSTSGSYTYTFPASTGTIALTSALANYVDLTTAQTIGGTKTFSDATKNNGGIFLQNASSNSLAGYMNIGGLTNGVKFTSGGGISNTFTLPSATGYTFTFPSANGTIALTSDISYPVTSVFGRTGAVVATEGDYNLTQLGDVTITSPSSGQALVYNGTSWVNNTETYTGTVTSVAMTVPTGLAVGGSPITTSGTLAVTFASGYSIPTTASQTNWDTAYTNRITSLTTTGSSGSATLVSNVLNIPTYTLSGLGGVPTTRTLTINGTAYDLSADRTWSVGTVTSVGLSSATTGVTIGSTPVTSSGTITLAIATASGSQQGLLSSADWTTFNNKQATITLTTTGTSGAATFTSNTLNIPNYGSALSGYLPLTGGTLTGALNGTSAVFTSSVTSKGLYVNGITDYDFYVGTSANSINFGYNSNAALATWINQYGYQNGTTQFRTLNIGNGKNGTIAQFNGSTSSSVFYGTGEFTDALTGTSASFSSSVTAGAGFEIPNGQYYRARRSSGSLLTDMIGIPSGTDDVRILTTGDFNVINGSLTNILTVKNGGNVGIGTTSPSYKLQVYNSSNGTTAAIGGTAYGLRIDNGGTFSSGRSTIFGVDNTFYGSYQPLSIEASSLTLQSLSGGNVLIGTTTDAGYKLDVNGTGRFSGDLTSTGTYYSTKTSGRSFGNDSYGTNFGWIAMYGTTQGIQLGFEGTTGGQLITGAGANYGILVGKTGLAISANNGGTNHLNIASTGAATFSSSVTATGFFESSDSRLKTLIQDNYQTKGIASITPKLYTKNGKVELGYYAQDFIGILDNAISKCSDDMLSLSYREVHTAKIYALEQEIKELKAKLN